MAPDNTHGSGAPDDTTGSPANAPLGEAVRVCSLADLPPSGGVKVLVEGRAPLAVWRVGERVWATDDTCTHGKASLVADGYLEGHVIECGMHQGSFDVRTGAVVAAPCRIPLRTYAVRIQGDEVFVTLD